MLIERLKLNNFRNYEEQEICFDPAMNIIIGENAQGKSNILEAISYLGLTFSFRDAEDKEMINWGKEHFFIAGDIINNSGEKQITAAYSMEKRKLWTIDGVNKYRLNDIFGQFYTVTFSPEDLFLIKRGPDLRRRFMNREMLQLYPDFCTQLSRFNKVLKQRNSLLKNECSEEQLLPWTEQLCSLAVEICLRRAKFIGRLNEFFSYAQNVISEEKETASIRYNSFFSEEELQTSDKESLYQRLYIHFIQNAAVEQARKITIAGPQRDDFLFIINGHDAKAFASQGQQRSLVLSLKLAQLRLAENILGEMPVLLLDDVLSELDAKRASIVLSLMSSHAQTFISGTENNTNYIGGKLFMINEGQVREVIK